VICRHLFDRGPFHWFVYFLVATVRPDFRTPSLRTGEFGLALGLALRLRPFGFGVATDFSAFFGCSTESLLATGTATLPFVSATATDGSATFFGFPLGILANYAFVFNNTDATRFWLQRALLYNRATDYGA